MTEATHTERFQESAAELASWPDLYARLLVEHPATGECTGCTMAGSQKQTAAPCSIRHLAELAATMRHRPGNS